MIKEKFNNLFEDEVDYSKPDVDRTFYLDIDGQRIWVTKEQYDEYKKPLWNERKEKELLGKCIIGAERGGIKRCRKPSSECPMCPHYRSGKTNGHMVSLDYLYEEYEFEPISNEKTPLDKVIEDERNHAIHRAINEIKDNIDRKIIELFMEGLSDGSIAEILGLSRKTINIRRLNTFKELAEKLKDYK